MALFEIRNLTFTYPDQEKPALTDLNFSLKQGEFLVVCGKSGCGKSTLLRHFKTAMAPYGERKGEILFEGRELDTVSVREQALMSSERPVILPRASWNTCCTVRAFSWICQPW